MHQIFVAEDFMLILAIIGAVGGIIVMIMIFSVIGFCRRSTSQKKKKAKCEFNFIIIYIYIYVLFTLLCLQRGGNRLGIKK